MGGQGFLSYKYLRGLSEQMNGMVDIIISFLLTLGLKSLQVGEKMVHAKIKQQPLFVFVRARCLG